MHSRTLQGSFLLPDPLAGEEVGLSQGSLRAGCHVPHITGVHSSPCVFFFLKGFVKTTLSPLQVCHL